MRAGIEIDLISEMGYKLTWVLCATAKLTRFCCGDRNGPVFVRGSKLTCRLCARRNLLVFSVEIVLLVFFVAGRSCLVFFYAGRKSLGFSVSIEIDLISVWGSIELISMWEMELDLI